MAFAYARLTEITTIADSAGALYTNAASTTTYIRSITIHNANTAAEDVLLYNVPDNAAAVGTPAVTNKFFEKSMAPNDTVVLEWVAPGLILTTVNDTIQGVTDTASKVTFQMMGATE
jgi:hypothetical protein